MAYRVAGVVVVPALVLYALQTWRRHRGRALVPVALWVAAGLLLLAFHVVRVPYADGISATVAAYAARIRWAVPRYQWVFFDAELYPSASHRGNAVYHVLASGLMVVGLVVLLPRLWKSFLLVLGAGYCAMILLAAVPFDRFLWPVFPLLAAALALGLETVLETVIGWLRKRWRPRPAASSAAPLHLPASGSSFLRSPSAVGATALLALVAAGALVSALALPRPPSFTAMPDAQALFVWLRSTNARTPLRVAFENPRVVTLETRVPAMGFPERSPPPGYMVAFAERGVTHLIWERDDLSPCLQRMANSLPALYPDRFVLEYENPTYRVYRLLAGRARARADSTVEMTAWTHKKARC
jgi:hypothetical protein